MSRLLLHMYAYMLHVYMTCTCSSQVQKNNKK